MFYGRGAGGAPTASAVLGDVREAAAALKLGGHRPIPLAERLPIKPIDDLPSAFCVNLLVADEPGVLAQVAGALAENGVSIRVMEQHDIAAEEIGTARLIFITHVAPERKLRQTLAAFDQLDVVEAIDSVLRVFGE
jgi:homoserine dehydrogenase